MKPSRSRPPSHPGPRPTLRRSLAWAGVCAALLAAADARAQCPSNASSCVVCHETGARPPSADGTRWHADHGYADVCVGCHGGDRERMDATAHQGQRHPLADPTATCAGCHTDGVARAAVYAQLVDERTSSPSPASPPPGAPPPSISGLDGALALVAALLAAAVGMLAAPWRPSPAALWSAARAPAWPPVIAGAGLGLVVAFSEAVCGRPIAVSGGVDRLAAFVGAWFLPGSAYFRFVVPPGVTWQVWLLGGLVLGAWASAALSGTARWRWLPEAGWTEAHGPSRSRRLALAFLGAALVQIGAGIAGGCTSGLAISGGALLSPGAFVFVAGMFAGGIPVAWLWAQGER